MTANRVYRVGLALAVAASLIVAFGLAGQWLVLGSEKGRWVYRGVQLFSVHSLIVGLLAAAAAGAALKLPTPEAGRQEWIAVVAWLVLGVALQGFIRSVTPFSFQSIFASDGANAFYSVTERHDPITVLREYANVQRSAAVHAQSNMPGKPMLVYALRLVSTRTDVLPWLVLALSSTGAPLMYVFVRQLFGDRRTALYAMVLYLFVPARLLFLPLMNTVTPVLVLASACLLMWWLRTGAFRAAAFLGLMLYALVFFEPLPLVMGLLFMPLALRAVAGGQMGWPQLVLQTCLMLLAFVAAAEAVQWLFGFNLVATFRRIGAHAVAFNASEARPYAVWIAANLWEFAVGAGICQSVLFCVAAGSVLTGNGRLHERLMAPLGIVCVSLFAVLLATDLIGINRGEVIRLWIFLACFFQIPAAAICARLPGSTAITLVTATSIVETALLTSTIGLIVP